MLQSVSLLLVFRDLGKGRRAGTGAGVLLAPLSYQCVVLYPKTLISLEPSWRRCWSVSSFLRGDHFFLTLLTLLSFPCHMLHSPNNPEYLAWSCCVVNIFYHFFFPSGYLLHRDKFFSHWCQVRVRLCWGVLHDNSRTSMLMNDVLIILLVNCCLFSVL